MATWTANRVHKLRRLIEARYSAAQAASEMRIDKSTAIRKAQALGLHFESIRPGSVKSIPMDRPAPNAVELATWRRMVRRERPPIPLPTDLRAIETAAEHKPLALAGSRECRWPMNPIEEPGAASTPLCCAPSVDGGPWCADHRALARPRAVA
ncbi:MAG: hypothetical protein KGL39_25295 [Patescibacteria group bacterium]|nr:hypothetical protein [Patescibacteria group bacterium]